MNTEVIESKLIDLGLSANYNGFKYITDIIKLLDQPEWKNPKWTALYQCVASIYHITGSLVEASIRTALKSIRTKCVDYKNIEYYIGFVNNENSSSLLQLYTRLKAESNTKKDQANLALLKQALRDLLG